MSYGVSLFTYLGVLGMPPLVYRLLESKGKPTLLIGAISSIFIVGELRMVVRTCLIVSPTMFFSM